MAQKNKKKMITIRVEDDFPCQVSYIFEHKLPLPGGNADGADINKSL